MAKSFAVYVIMQWVRGTFPRVRIDQMMAFAWKVLVPLVLALILWQMVAMKLPMPTWLQYVGIFVGNLVVVAYVVRVLAQYFRGETLRTKRAFAPRSLIGTMRPAPEAGGD